MTEPPTPEDVPAAATVPDAPDAPDAPTRRPFALLRRRPVQGAAAGLLVIGTAAALLATAPAGSSTPQPPGAALSVNTASCGQAPAQLPAGPVSFSVTNTSDVYVSVYVVSADAKLAYAEIPWLGPKRTLPLATTLTGGSYAVRCVFSSGPVQTTGTIAVTGTAAGAVRGYLPMNDMDLSAPVTAYRAYVSAALPELLAAVQTLDGDLARGDLDAARADWLTAHLAYERLGAAYGSFGDFDSAMNGMAGGLAQGVDTPGWTGFFALEHGLWHGARPDQLRPISRRLVTDAAGLIEDFPSEDTDPGTLPLRAHEILENALQFQLGGIADYGSGSTLATLQANVQGTEEVLSVLAPLIQPRDPGLLTRLQQQLPVLEHAVDAFKKPSGGWTPVAQLPAGQRRALDGQVGALLEQLAAVPNLLTPRNHA
ncbi:EfeM/EfeO family lipoprotein [Kitasatospora sp. NPDC006697]|uniref:EfeM/EfeO family lipoprotein n=1 Tax=Kitasatospora sp. NPDC006697 TaxID=3364020 RepID=UPI00369F8F87